MEAELDKINEMMKGMNELQKAKMGALVALTILIRSEAKIEFKLDFAQKVLDVMGSCYKRCLSLDFAEKLADRLPKIDGLTKNGMKDALMEYAELSAVMAKISEECDKDAKDETEHLKNMMELI